MPLISFNTYIDKYIKILFLTPSTDSTAYNIAISYVAAYIFYIIQVYIPSALNNKHGIILLKKNIEKNINNIRILLLIISQLVTKKQNELYLNDDVDILYIIEEKHNQLFKVTFLKTYDTLKKLIINGNDHILNSPMLNYLDNNLSELLCTLPLEDLFILSDNLYSQKQKHTNTTLIDNSSLSKIIDIISKLEQQYGFSFERYNATKDINLHSKYVESSLFMTEYMGNELQIKVKLDEGVSSLNNNNASKNDNDYKRKK